MSFRIDTVWAWTTIDEDDEEGIPAFLGPGGVAMPMVAADQHRIESLRPMAQRIATQTGRRLCLRRFGGDGAIVEFVDP